MLLTNISCTRVGAGRALRLRTELLSEIFADFSHAFPELSFELDEASSTVNAQAIVRPGSRVVRMYGGLAYHAFVGADALVFTLLHETGHHLSSGGRLASRDELGCECAADRWALTKGSRKLRQETGRSFAIAEVIASLERLTGPVPGHCATTNGPKHCWAVNWSKRKRILAAPESIPPVQRCHLSEFFASETKYL